jgi:hypothetical protein
MTAKANPRPLSKAVRSAKREDLQRLVLAASLRASELLADDLTRLARDEAVGPEVKRLSLALHRLQLVASVVSEDPR